MPEHAAEPQAREGLDTPEPRSRWAPGSLFVLLFGVILPAVTVAFELTTRMCAETFFDPIPTPGYVALASSVPLTLLVVRAADSPGRRALAWLRFLTGLAVGVAGMYALRFAPLYPLALLALPFMGLGIFPLAPLLSLVAAIVTSRDLADRAKALGATNPRLSPTWIGIVLACALPAVLNIERGLASIAIRYASSQDDERVERGVALLRLIPDKTVLLELCYDTTPSSPLDVVSVFANVFGPIRAAEARRLYYRVTGTPFNAVEPPRSHGSAWETSPLLGWDRAQGTDRVAGRLTGLSLTESRIDGALDAESAHAYLEWTQIFRNTSRTSREARGVVQLPPGGVVSRLTLWVNGEEREAAFSGRSETRAAYRSVVERRLDPVLVTTAGPDRVLVQCFPVPPEGDMRIRVGITAPLVLPDHDRALLIPPRFVERNFAVEDLEHAVWLESSSEFLDAPPSLRTEAQDGRLVARGGLPDAELHSLATRLELTRSPARESWSRALVGDGAIRQTVAEAGPRAPARLAVVVDGSASGAAHADALADALEDMPAELPLAVWLAGDEVEALLPWGGDGAARGRAAQAVRDHAYRGGTDAVPALRAALDSLSLGDDAELLWLHGPQPVLLAGTSRLEQVLERRACPVRIHALPLQAGPNRVLDALDALTTVTTVPRTDELARDLASLFEAWWGRGAIAIERSRVDEDPPEGVAPAPGHLARLWAHGEVRALLAQDVPGARDRALALAVEHQLVTPVSGAVVLETEGQYRAAGLTPVDPATVPSVPEPETWLLLLLGSAAVAHAERRRRARERRAEDAA